MHIQCSFKEKDAFVGYQKDVAAAVLLQATNQLRNVCKNEDGMYMWKTALENGMPEQCSLEVLRNEKETSDLWKKGVRK